MKYIGKHLSKYFSNDGIIAAICYILWIIAAIIILLLKRYKGNKFIKFNAWQAIFFNVLWAITDFILLLLLSFILHMKLSYFSIGNLYIAFNFFYFWSWIFLIIKAYRKEKAYFPYIGLMCEKLILKSD